MWLYMQKTAILKVGGRVIQNPPSYSFIYRLGTTLEQVGGNPVHSWVIERLDMVSNKDTLESCISFAKSFQQGEVGIAPDHDEEQQEEMADVTPNSNSAQDAEEISGVKF